MSARRYRVVAIGYVLLMMLTISCAIRSNEATTSALTVGEMALTIDQQERNAFAAKLYDAATHERLGGYVLRILYGARSYERAVAAGQDASISRKELLSALDDLAAAARGIDIIQDAVQGVRNVLGGAP